MNKAIDNIVVRNTKYKNMRWQNSQMKNFI